MIDIIHVNKRSLGFSIIFEGCKGSPQDQKVWEQCLRAISSFAFFQFLFSVCPLLLSFSKSHLSFNSVLFLHHMSLPDQEMPYLELYGPCLSYILGKNLCGITSYALRNCMYSTLVFHTSMSQALCILCAQDIVVNKADSTPSPHSLQSSITTPSVVGQQKYRPTSPERACQKCKLSTIKKI